MCTFCGRSVSSGAAWCRWVTCGGVEKFDLMSSPHPAVSSQDGPQNIPQSSGSDGRRGAAA